MAYSELILTHFRSYHEYRATFSPGVTIIVGPNGSGKTNLLEAVYVLSQGSSFRVSDKDLVRYGQEFFRLEGSYGDQRRILAYSTTKLPAKQFKFDNVMRQRLSHQQRVQLVLFEPEDLRLLSGSPQRRRDYLDTLIGRLWPEAAVCRSRYERALLQRNNIIKQASILARQTLEDQFFIWDIKLAEYATQLFGQRLQLIEYWSSQLSDIYSHIAGKTSKLEIHYRTQGNLAIHLETYKSRLLQHLQLTRDQDIARGFTSTGPHRDDFTASLNGVDAAISASRGEVRSIVLALKIIELELLEKISNHSPILLLDDVFSELDMSRRRALASLAQDRQTLITTTDASDIARHFPEQHRIVL